jgi:hypothetical protein
MSDKTPYSILGGKFKEFRFTIYFHGKAVDSKWHPYTLEKFLERCEAYADNDLMFTVEFRYV